MNKGLIIWILAWMVIAGSFASAQDEQPTPPAASASGQESSEPSGSENPPISAVDEPSLEPHSAPESFLLPGLHFSESIESNVGNTPGGNGVAPVTRGLGSLTLQKLWQHYDVAMDYVGGVSDYDTKGIGVQQLQQFDVDNRIHWKRGQLAIRDSFSYLPEGSFGYGAYGGGGAYEAGFGSLGAGLLGAGAFGGQNSAFTGANGLGVSLGLVPRITNLGLVDVVEDLTPKSSLTLMVSYGLVHFYGDLIDNTLAGPVEQNIHFIGSSEYTGQVAYDRLLNPKDQVAVSYGYQYFNFSTAGTAFHSQVIQLMYGHRISGRMSFLVSAGPQFTGINQEECTIPTIPVGSCAAFGGSVNTTGVSNPGVAGRASLHYRFPKTSLSLSFQRYDTSGSGIYAGAETNVAQFDVTRPLTRVWDLFADAGYSHDSELQLPGAVVTATSFSYGFAGIGVHRHIGRSLRAFVSYQFNALGFSNGCKLATISCSSTAQQQVGSFGLDWTPRPIRLD
jgi:hypothetical protein